MHKLTVLTCSLALGLIFTCDVICANEAAQKKAPKKQQKKTPVAPKEKVNPLKEALTSAYITNSDLRAKLHTQYANDENVSQAISAFRPSVSLFGNAQDKLDRQKQKSTNNQRVTPESPAFSPDPNDPVNNPPVPNPSRSGLTKSSNSAKITTKNLQGGVNVSQSLYRGGGDLANLRAQESGVKAGQYSLIDTEQQTLQKATQAYMEVMFQTALVKNNSANVSFLSEQLKSVQAQVEVGEKTPTDTAAAESQLAAGNAALVKSQGDLATAKANYQNIIGEQPGLLEYPSPLPGLPKALDEVVGTALKSNPTILNAEYIAKQQGYNIDAQTASLLPSLTAEASASRSLGSNPQDSDQTNNFTDTRGFPTQTSTTASKQKSKSWTNSASVGLQLTVPLYGNGGADYSKVRQQMEATASARYNLEQARKTVQANAVAAWDALNTAREQIVSFKAQLDSATVARNGAQLEADVGERSYVDVLAFQQKVLDAENSLEQAKRDEVNAQYALYAVLGKLNARELELPVSIYDVEGHLDSVRYKIAGFGDTPQILDGKNE